MAITSTNIIMGAGTLFVQAANLPEGNLFDTNNDVGATIGGVMLNYEGEDKEIEVDQSLSPVGVRRVKEKMTVKTQMAEATLNNMLLAWGLPAVNLKEGGTKLTFGEKTVKDVPEKMIGVMGIAPNGNQRKATFWRGVAKGSAEVAYKKDDLVVLNVEFTIMGDDSKDDGETLGYFKDLNADGTAPTVACVPADGAAAVAVNASIVLTFSDEMRQGTLNSDNVLVLSDSGELVAAAYSLDVTRKILTVNPNADLDAATGYIVRVTRNAKNINGVAAEPASFAFATA